MSWYPGFGTILAGYCLLLSKRAFNKIGDKLAAKLSWYSTGFVFVMELVVAYKFYAAAVYQ